MSNGGKRRNGGGLSDDEALDVVIAILEARILVKIQEMQDVLLARFDQLEGHLMAEIDDLQTNIGNLTTAVDGVDAKVTELEGSVVSGVDPAAVAQAAVDVQTQTDRLTEIASREPPAPGGTPADQPPPA